jgi:hypothetical protein
MEENINKNRKITNTVGEIKLEMIKKHNLSLDTSSGLIMTSNLSQETCTKLNSLFTNSICEKKSIWNYLPKFNKKITQQEILNNSLIKSINLKKDLNAHIVPLEPSEKFVMELAYKILTKNGFYVEREGTIDYWSFDLTNDENTAVFFDVYKDNELFNFNVETCIFYTQSDNGLTGNIDYYKVERVHNNFPIPHNSNFINDNDIDNNIDNDNDNEYESKYQQQTNIIKQEIIINSGLVVLISGNQLYCPQPLYGTGKRNYMVVKLRSKKKL